MDGSISLDKLTHREHQILKLLTTGLTDSEIAEAIIISVGTVKWYNRQIFNKLGVHNRTEAAAVAQRLGELKANSRPSLPATTVLAPHNLPAPINAFIGRNQEKAELKATLLASRLVTLTGAPGTGKTRLALEAASQLLEHYPDGVYAVFLAALGDTNLIAPTIAQTLGAKETGSESSLNTLKAWLRDKHLLLVLDNFEHLLPEAPLISDLLTSAPHLTVLVTSREILRLYGEREFPVPPLDLPDLKQDISASALRAFEAVELFVQRARSLHPNFDLNSENAQAVAAICVHLDGLPLAIELAAARIRFHAPQTLLLRLGSRLEALGEGPRDLPARQRTLRATLAWSYDLLTPQEQTLFARLGIFVGRYSAADVEAVCGDGQIDVLACMESLLNKSLIQRIYPAVDQPYFMMLETMREYALEKLAASGESSLMHERSTRYFLSLAEESVSEMTGPNALEWLKRLDILHDNLRAVLQASLAGDNGEVCLRISGSLWHFWVRRGYLSEGRAWITDALRLKGAQAPTQLRAETLKSAGEIAYIQCDYPAARKFHEEALSIFQHIGNQQGIARALSGLGDTETAVGDYDKAESLFLQAVEITQQNGDHSGTAWALTYLAWIPIRSRGDYQQAKTYLEQSLVVFQQESHGDGMALAYSGLGEVAIRQGELAEAQNLLEQSLRLCQQLGVRWGIASAFGSLGWVAQLQGDFDKARSHLRESVLIRRDIGDPGGIAWCLEKLAEIAHLSHDDGCAARVFAAAFALRLSVNSTIDAPDVPAYERILAHVRANLGEEVYKTVWDEGLSMSLEQLFAYLGLSL